MLVRDRTLLLITLLATVLLAVPADAGRRPAGAATERVEVTALVEPALVASYLRALGGRIELQSQRRIQALMPPERLAEVARATALLRVEPPAYAIPLQVVPATSLMGVDRWRAAGFTGHGVRVAVLDSGFEGYVGQLGTSLPAEVRMRSFRSDGQIEAGTDHGTRAAQVVHAIAPEAELYLLNFSTVTELSAAVDFIVEEQIDVVSFSLGFIHSGPGDGTGSVDDIFSRGAGEDVVWVVSSGNWAQQHWAGVFIDDDGDTVHEFAAGVSHNGHDFVEGDLIVVSLRWSDVWGEACSDYDLEMFGPDGSLVRASRRIQDCSGNPVEGFQVLATAGGSYAVRIVQAASESPAELELMVVGSPDRGATLDFFVDAGSLSEPADHPGVLTVGALAGEVPLHVAAFSSRGPTVDGRSKPEVLSPTGVEAPGQSTFAGTSAAAPHVAAVAAMLREARPEASADSIRAELIERAVDLSTSPPAGAPERLANLGSLTGLGLLLPVGAEEAGLMGELPPSEGLALLVYSGPDGYPLRFAHLLTGGRDAAAFFRFDAEAQAWERHIFGAPVRVNQFETLSNGTVYVVRFPALELAEARP